MCKNKYQLQKKKNQMTNMANKMVNWTSIPLRSIAATYH